MVVDGTGTLAPGEGVVENTMVIVTDSAAANDWFPNSDLRHHEVWSVSTLPRLD